MARAWDGIIFDMDNTLLQSSIDFAAMKAELYRFMADHGVLPRDMDCTEHTCATIIELGRSRGLPAELERKVWAIAERHESEGMTNAGLEPGAWTLLEALRPRYKLALLTNNARKAADRALAYTGIGGFFELVVAREQMTALKPSSSGVEVILDAYSLLPATRWLSVGDSWIDGMAAQRAGVSFISYKTDMRYMQDMGVQPVAVIAHLSELLSHLDEQT